MRFQIDPRRRAVIAAARAWVGTPFRHQARLMGVGVDCAQHVIAAGETAGVLSIDPAAWRRWAAYGRAPNPRRMGEALETFLVPIPPSRARLGDVMWLAWERAGGQAALPMHLAIRSAHGGRTTMIHALESLGKVCEHGFTAEWPGRVISWWRYPGLAAAPIGPDAVQMGPA
jgi:cell wall-associated NlpC family hydrolase